MIKLVSEMTTDELISYANELGKLGILGYLDRELLNRLTIAMEIIAHDSQQQSNH